MPKVSIVLPSFNGSLFIKDSIQSILAQTFEDFELIIVNDCSTDNTLEICNEFAKKDKRIRIISNYRNLKLPASLNAGFLKAQGDYLTWTSDDNLYKVNAIEKMVEALDSNPKIDLVSFNYDFIKEDGSFDKRASAIYPTRKPWQLAFMCNVGACFMYRKSIAKLVGEYDTDLFCAEDFDYWCRIALQGNIEFCDESLYLYRNNSKSLSSTKREVIAEKTEKIQEKYLAKILKKYGFSDDIICRELIQRYVLMKNSTFLKTSLKISVLKTVYALLQSKFTSSYRSLLTFPFNPLYCIYKKKLQAQKDVLIWGTSGYGKYLYSFIKDNFSNCNVVAFVNTFAKDDKNTQFCELPVLSPRAASIKYPNSCFILASEYFESMQLFEKENHLNLEIVELASEAKYLERLAVTYRSNQDKLNTLYYLSANSIYNLK